MNNTVTMSPCHLTHKVVAQGRGLVGRRWVAVDTVVAVEGGMAQELSLTGVDTTGGELGFHSRSSEQRLGRRGLKHRV